MNTLSPNQEAGGRIASVTLDPVEESAVNLQAFHLLGYRARPVSDSVQQYRLQPALLADYHDLSCLRFDFPLVLTSSDTEQDWQLSLTQVMDDYLRQNPSEGSEAELQRQLVFALEQKIRTQMLHRCQGSFRELWAQAREDILAQQEETESSALENILSQLESQLPLTGELIGFTDQVTAQVTKRAWKITQDIKARELYRRIHRLVLELTGMLRVKYLQSPQGRSAQRLVDYVGSGDRNEFDFQALADVLASAPVGEPLPELREKRIQEAIDVLQAQNFVSENGIEGCCNYHFTSLRDARIVFHQRQTDMSTLIRAISIAELETENRYNAEMHDNFYQQFIQQPLSEDDLAIFPSYYVYIESAHEAERQREIIAALQECLPFKIVAATDHIMGDSHSSTGLLSFGIQGQQLARMAMGLSSAYTLQSPASALYSVRSRIMDGFASIRPALMSIFTGRNSGYDSDDGIQGEHSRYLSAAAAGDSRAFPCFAFDPLTEPESSFSLEHNPHRAEPWIHYDLHYENSQRQPISLVSAFTVVDFIAIDRQYREYFCCCSQSDWTDNMVEADHFLNLDPAQSKGKVPYIWLVDDDGHLHRAVVNSSLIEAGKRVVQYWQQLQNLARVHQPDREQTEPTQENTAEGKKANKEESEATEQATTSGSSIAKDQSAGPGQGEAPVAESEPDKPGQLDNTAARSDDPWIDSVRCTSCNECTLLNDRMFAYDSDMRAYIADPDAGPFRELVEAAENCQVAIIHPGKPRNPDEPGLAELIERAEPFQG